MRAPRYLTKCFGQNGSDSSRSSNLRNRNCENTYQFNTLHFSLAIASPVFLSQIFIIFCLRCHLMKMTTCLQCNWRQLAALGFLFCGFAVPFWALQFNTLHSSLLGPLLLHSSPSRFIVAVIWWRWWNAGGVIDRNLLCCTCALNLKSLVHFK